MVGVGVAPTESVAVSEGDGVRDGVGELLPVFEGVIDGKGAGPL